MTGSTREGSLAVQLTLTPPESALLQKLKTQELQWPAMRWLLLGLGLFNVFNGWREFAKDGDPALATIMLAIGVLALMKAAAHWRGNPTRVLLLRLLEGADAREPLTR